MSQTLSIAFETSRFAEIFAFAFAGFALSMALTPIYTTLAYKCMWWKKPRTQDVTGKKAKLFAKLHAAKYRRNIPTMAGVIFLLSVSLITLTSNLSREQTWVPLAAFVAAGLVGLFDDYINLKGDGKGVAGLPPKFKLLFITSIATVCSWYLFAKLDITAVNVPFVGDITLGWLVVPLFVLVIVATANAVNISDGVDGLAGGLAASAFGAFALIAFIDERYGVAAFSMTIVGALLSYTWFNLFPARFFMGDVGSFSLGTALGVIAILTNTVFLLPIIGVVFVAEAGSTLLQILSKKLRGGKKIFKIAPVHHHFEALGWEETKVTMRFWIIGQIAGFVGLLVYLLGVYGK
jgi:phospho-N-acetylmuramoyl-pentapeptide-transferase